MSRRRIAVVVMAAAALVGPVLLAPSPTTGAYWSKQLTDTLPDARSDAFAVTIGNVTNVVDHSQANTTVVANAPGVSIKNNAERHTSWIDVVSTRVTVPASNTFTVLLRYTNLDYAVSNNCTTGLSPSSPTYWDVNGGVDGVKPNVTYNRTSTAVTGADLLPGQTKTVCPWVRPIDNTSTVSGRRAFLFAHAGRQLDIATTLRQQSFSAGTWTSNQEVVNTRYQVQLPPPTRRSQDNEVCARTTQGGAWSNGGLWGRLYWAWPFAADGETSTTTNTAAIDRFELIRSTDGITWKPFRESANQDGSAEIYTTNRDKRLSSSINSLHLMTPNDPPVYLSVRAFPYAGRSVFVDADWKVKVRTQRVGLSAFFTCLSNGSDSDKSSGEPNPNSAPVGLD